MRALKDTIASLGAPVLIRPLGIPSMPAATIARWQCGAATVEVAPSDTIQLAMSLIDGQEARFRSPGFLADRVRSGSISVFSPAEGARISVNGEADVLQLFVQQAYAAAAIGSDFDCPPMFDMHDDRMQAIVMQILVASARREPDDSLLVEEGLHGLARLIGHHATRRRSQRRASTAPIRGGLSPAALRKVEDLIGVALDEAGSPSLLDMASAAGLSVTHFVRAFRHQTGTTPHKYLVGRRMERAVSLLRSSHVPVAEVADEVGFSTPAHFVATFRNILGVTPSAVRDALAN